MKDNMAICVSEKEIVWWAGCTRVNVGVSVIPLECRCIAGVACVRVGGYAYSVVMIATSVTIFGEISPLLLKITSTWQILGSLFLIWQNAEPTLANL